MELTLDLKKRYTYADYLTWAESFACELIDGFIHIMSPKPRISHQRIGGNIFVRLFNNIKKFKGNCDVIYEANVHFSKDKNNNEILTVLSPDIIVVCDKSKLTNDLCCVGAPDLVVEILSDDRKRDMVTKFRIYEKNGVLEYWIADPKTKSISAFILQENGEYNEGAIYVVGEKLPVNIFNGLEIELNDIF